MTNSVPSAAPVAQTTQDWSLTECRFLPEDRGSGQARTNTQDEKLTFRQVHIFHTEQSLRALMASNEKWKQALSHYSVPVTSLVHHVAKIEDSNIDRFRDLVRRLWGEREARLT